LAHRDVAKANAEGEAALVLEEGKARATAIELIGQAIQKHPDALKVMLVEQMPRIVEQVAKSVNNIALGEVTVIDSGNGQAVAGAATARARTLAETLAVLESILGVDVRAVSKAVAGSLTKNHEQP
jgi:flotillin